MEPDANGIPTKAPYVEPSYSDVFNVLKMCERVTSVLPEYHTQFIRCKVGCGGRMLPGLRRAADESR